MMFFRTSLLFACILYSCANSPSYKAYSKDTIIRNNYSTPDDSVHVSIIDLISVQTKSSIKTKVLDTLQVEFESSVNKFDSIRVPIPEGKKQDSQSRRTLKLPYKTKTPSYLDSLKIRGVKLIHNEKRPPSHLKLPYKKWIPRYLKSLDIDGDAMVFFPTYRYSVSDEREGGGNIGFSYDTGYQRHNVTHELYVVIYRDSQLIYSNNAVRFEQIRTKKGDSIKHEFPEGIADTLMNKVLRDYVERLQ
jgi:hypothetical protein